MVFHAHEYEWAAIRKTRTVPIITIIIIFLFFTLGCKDPEG